MLIRFRAFFLHLLLSGTLALLVMLLVYRIWYPAPLHEALGVTHVFLLLLVVDVILGPLLTFVVYRKGKKTLLFDLGVVAALQVAALCYGVWTVAQGRPVWLVFNADRFDAVRVSDIDERSRAKASAEFQRLPWFGPEWAVAVQPVSAEEQGQVLFEALSGGSDIAQRPDLYHPLGSQFEMIRKRLHPLEELAQFNDSESLKRLTQAWPEADSWLPLMASTRPMVVLFNGRANQALGIVSLWPWGSEL